MDLPTQIGATRRLFDWLGGALYWVVVVLVADTSLQADDRPCGFFAHTALLAVGLAARFACAKQALLLRYEFAAAAVTRVACW